MTRRWNARAHVCWATTTYVFVVYLVFMLWWTFASHLGITGDVGGTLLWLLELVAAVLGCAYLWELCDTLGRASWVRRIGTQELAEMPDGPYPFVCLQVPCYNEPPDMVIATLESLRALDYPNYEIQVLDDNTDDEALWRPVEAWCREHDVKFVHLSDWPGYKSGALNYALEHMVEDSCELIGVIDSDYQIEPQFLRQCAPLFGDDEGRLHPGAAGLPRLAGRSVLPAALLLLPLLLRGLPALAQRARRRDLRRHDGADPAPGARAGRRMGRVVHHRGRRAVAADPPQRVVGPARRQLVRQGHHAAHLRGPEGPAIPLVLRRDPDPAPPLAVDAGGRDPDNETEQNHLSLGQRWAYLCGAIQWYGDLLALLFFFCLLVGAGNIVFSGGLVFRKLTGFLLAAIPLLVVLGLLRAVALLRRGTGASWRDALGAFLIWQSTTLTVTSASVQGLFAKEAAFLRTPKTHGDPSWSDALKANWVECLFGCSAWPRSPARCHATSPGGLLLAALLLWPTVSFLAAPYNSLSAQHAALPPDLRERRRTEYLRYGRRRLTYAVGGLGLAGGTAAVALGLFVPGTGNIVAPQLIGPAKGQPVHYGQATTPSSAKTSGTAGKSNESEQVEEPERVEHDDHEHDLNDPDDHHLDNPDDVDDRDDDLHHHVDRADHDHLDDARRPRAPRRRPRPRRRPPPRRRRSDVRVVALVLVVLALAAERDRLR